MRTTIAGGGGHRQRSRIPWWYGWILVAILLLVYAVVAPATVSAFASVGGYISERLLSRTAATTAVMHLGDGTAEHIVVGGVPVISTGAATGMSFPAAGATATLNSTLSSLNGFPEADVWFEWGYTADSMTNSTPVVTVVATGAQSATITGYNPGLRVYYRAMASTDAVAIGATTDFVVSGARGVSFWLLYNIVPLLIAAGIFITVLMLGGRPVLALIGAIVGLIGISIVLAILESLV